MCFQTCSLLPPAGPSYQRPLDGLLWQAGFIPLASDAVCPPHRLFGPTQVQTVKVSHPLIIMGYPRSRRQISGQTGAFGPGTCSRPPLSSPRPIVISTRVYVELSLLTQKADRKILSPQGSKLGKLMTSPRGIFWLPFSGTQLG